MEYNEFSWIEIFAAGKELALELLVIGLVFFLIEKIRPAEEGTPFFKKDFSSEMAFAFLNGVISIPLFAFLITFIFTAIVRPLVPYQMFDAQLSALPLLAQVGIAALIMDFSTYWRHRFTHQYLWSYHSVHHSARQLTWLTALRLHPVDVLAATLFDMTMLYFFGFSGEGIVMAMIVMRLYNYFTHANLNLEFDRPLCYVLASPNFHRWHHAVEKEAIDRNFCSMFSLLDLIFGTYYHPEKRLPSGYGLSRKQQEEYPDNLAAQLLYPFTRDLRLLKKRFGKKK